MAKQFSGKVAVVTGGTQGLGEAIARLFAERGAAGLVVVGRDKKRGKAVADEITEKGCKTVFVAADLGDLDRRAQGRPGGGEGVRPRRRAGQRRRNHRPRHHPRHQPGALRRDVRRQRPRALLPHAGRGEAR